LTIHNQERAGGRGLPHDPNNPQHHGGDKGVLRTYHRFRRFGQNSFATAQPVHRRLRLQPESESSLPIALSVASRLREGRGNFLLNIAGCFAAFIALRSQESLQTRREDIDAL
jgi:hypothetical protein